MNTADRAVRAAAAGLLRSRRTGPFLRGVFSRMTIAGKMLVGYAVLVLLTLGVVGYLLVSLSRINSLNRNIVMVDVPAQTLADKLLDAVLAQNTFEKRYLILRRKDMRHLFWERAKEVSGLLQDLRELERKTPLPVGEIEELHAHYGDLFLEMVRHVQAGRIKAAEALSNGAMNGLVRQMLELLRSIPPRVRASRDAQMRMISLEIRSTFRTTVIVCAVSTIVSVLAGLAVTLYISSMLQRLKRAAGHVAEGDFEQGVNIATNDEIGDLARSFDTMRIRLKKLEEMYRDASPLTRLPGGIAIEQNIQGRLDRDELMALCVMDLDNFKAFNDRYGYAHGNDVIVETAKILERAVKVRGGAGDFVGHIGGDDFVAVTVPERMYAVCDEVIAQFDRRIPEFYSTRDRERGYIEGKTRQGDDAKFPLMTISIAIVTNQQRRFTDPLEMSQVAVELKEYAKTFSRSLYVVDKRRS